MGEGKAEGGRGVGVWLIWFWAGIVAFGVIGFAGFFLGSSLTGSAMWLATAAMAAVTAGLAVWAIRAGNLALGSGMLAGYAVATAFSAGQCTFWSASADYGFLGGALAYLFTAAAALVAAVIAAVVEAYRKNMSSQ